MHSTVFRILCLPLFFLLSCENSSEPRHALDTLALTKNIHPARISVPKMYLDSVRTIMDEMIARAFDIKDQDWSCVSYYHRSYNGFYCMRHNALTCAVTVYGEIVLVSSLSSENAGHQHDQLYISVGDTVYHVGPSYTHVAAVASGMGNTECTTFSPENDVAWAIAQHASEEIIVNVFRDDERITTYTLGEKEKQAFPDCVKLAEVVKRVYALRDISEDNL